MTASVKLVHAGGPGVWKSPRERVDLDWLFSISLGCQLKCTVKDGFEEVTAPYGFFSHRLCNPSETKLVGKSGDKRISGNIRL